jgi:hypothetical protein
MIDFISSRTDIDDQTAACARLIAAVIAQAIRDACERPSNQEKHLELNRHVDALHAIDFLFNNASVFPRYAALIGASHESIRSALLEPTGGGIDEGQRRIIRIRLQWYRQEMAAKKAARPRIESTAT